MDPHYRRICSYEEAHLSAGLELLLTQMFHLRLKTRLQCRRAIGLEEALKDVCEAKIGGSK